MLRQLRWPSILVSALMLWVALGTGPTLWAQAPPQTPPGAQPQKQKRDTQSADGEFRFAEGLFLRKFYDLAEKEFRFFVETYPQNKLAPQAMFHLIKCLRFENKTDATLSAISQFQTRWPNNELTPKLFLWKGEVLLDRKEYATAASCFKQLVLSTDSIVQEAALYFLAQCYARESKADLAVATYAKIANLPFDATHIYRPYALFALGAAHQNQGEFDKAAKAFQRLCSSKHVPSDVREESLYRLGEAQFAEGQFAKAVEQFETLLVDFPNGLFAREARKRRAWAYFSMADYAKAVKAAKDWRQHYGDSFDYEMDYIQGASLVGIGFYNEALPFFDRIAHDPRVPTEYHRLARFQQVDALMSLKQYKDCIALAQQFIRDFPKSEDVASIHFMAGESYWNLKDYAKAVEHFRLALDSYTGKWPYLETATLRLTDCLQHLGRYKEAATVYRQFSTNPAASQPAYCRLRAAECECKAGDTKQAIKDFETVLTKFPRAGKETESAMIRLGELYSQQGDYKRAEAMVQRMLKSHTGPSRARLLFFLGYLCYQQKLYKKAVVHLTDALAAKGAGAVTGIAKFYLGGSLLEEGKPDEALGYFGDVLKLPEAQRPPFSADLLFRLEKLYFARSRLDVSEAICRWLATWKSGAVVYRATLRLSDILAARNHLPAAEKTLLNLQKDIQAGKLTFAKGQKPPPEEALSVLAEIYLLENKHDQAVQAAEACLNDPNLDIDYLTRARWVMGEILYSEKHPQQALPYAVKCFVLADDPVYTPRAMWLAVQIFVALGKPGDARTTWQELLNRYPAFAEEKRDLSPIKELLQKTPETQKANVSGKP